MQLHNIKEYNKGKILANNQVIAFKLFGRHYITNLKRTKCYSFDHPTWKVIPGGFLYKLSLIYQRKVKQVKLSTKAKTAGVK